MKQFEYIRAASIRETSDILAHYGEDAKVLAGGTDLLIELRRQNGDAPGIIIDISNLSKLRSIESTSKSISIKPLITHSDLIKSKDIRQFAPLLAAAAATIGSPQIRNRGTIGGNIMNAATCADTVPPLIALGAAITLQSKKGKRKIELEKFFTAPYTTLARPDEFLIDIHFPKLPRNAGSSFIKLGRRNALSISRLSVAAIVVRDRKGRIADARIVPGATFPTWRRVHDAEKLLFNEKPSKELFVAAGKKVSEEMIRETGRRWSSEYKEPVIAVLVRRALEECCLAGKSDE